MLRKTTSTQTIETIRAILAKELPYSRTFVVNGRTYHTVGHQTSEGTRYNLQIGNRFYQDLTISGMAAAISVDGRRR